LKSFAQPIGIFSDKIVAPAHGGCGWEKTGVGDGLSVPCVRPPPRCLPRGHALHPTVAANDSAL
jgi:hypothetical protein